MQNFSFQRPVKEPDVTFFNEPLDKFYGRTGIRPSDLWDEDTHVVG